MTGQCLCSALLYRVDVVYALCSGACEFEFRYTACPLQAMVTAEQRKLQRAEMERLRLEAKARKEAEKLKKEQEKR